MGTGSHPGGRCPSAPLSPGYFGEVTRKSQALQESHRTEPCGAAGDARNGDTAQPNAAVPAWRPMPADTISLFSFPPCAGAVPESHLCASPPPRGCLLSAQPRASSADIKALRSNPTARGLLGWTGFNVLSTSARGRAGQWGPWAANLGSLRAFPTAAGAAPFLPHIPPLCPLRTPPSTTPECCRQELSVGRRGEGNKAAPKQLHGVFSHPLKHLRRLRGLPWPRCHLSSRGAAERRKEPPPNPRLLYSRVSSSLPPLGPGPSLGPIHRCLSLETLQAPPCRTGFGGEGEKPSAFPPAALRRQRGDGRHGQGSPTAGALLCSECSALALGLSAHSPIATPPSRGGYGSGNAPQLQTPKPRSVGPHLLCASPSVAAESLFIVPAEGFISPLPSKFPGI